MYIVQIYHQLFLQRHGSSGLGTDSSWHKISEVKEKDSVELIVALGPEEACNLITSQSSDNRWVDGYLRDERLRPPFGFEQSGQELKLSHLSGSTNLNTRARRLCFHWKLQPKKVEGASVSNKENKPLSKTTEK